MMREASLKSLTAWRLTHILAAYLFLFIVAAIKIRVSQAVTKDLSSSSKFSGSCVLTLQTLQIKEKERRSVCVNTCQDPLRTSFLSSLWSLRCHLLIAEAIDDIMIKGKERLDEESKHEVINFYSFSLYKSFLLIICKWLKRLRENELDFFHNLLFLSSCWHSLSFSFMCQQDNERK